MTDDEMDAIELDALLHYALWDDVNFTKLTEGPRHQRALLRRSLDKLSNSLLREQLIAKILGLTHNPRMHSTTNGITTFDAVHPVSNDCYEIKAESHITNNPHRKKQSGQITGSGVFSGITNQNAIDLLCTNNPIIAHGMFGDGRLLSLSTFRLSDTKCLDRITRYCLGNTQTEPRYALADWIDCSNVKFEYVSDQWPGHIAPKYREIFLSKWVKQKSTELNIVLPNPDSIA